MSSSAGPARARARRSDGERSRSAILHEAARLATVEGLDGLSIARLADAVGMSKSGLFAHFGSKEELQLATIDTASAVFADQVVTPAIDLPQGVERLRALADGFLDHVERGVFPGGCFFAAVATELAAHPGRVRDRAVQTVDDWFEALTQAVRDAQSDGAIDPAEDPVQLAFEVHSFLLLANTQFVLGSGPAAMARARRAIDRLLADVAPTA